MIKLLVYLLFTSSVLSLFRAPWFAAVAYSAVALMQPKYVWRWEFVDWPLSKYLAIVAILAWCFKLLNGKMDFGVYKNKQTFILLAMWASMYLSDMFSPYQTYFAGTRAEIVFSALNSLMIIYLISLGLITSTFEETQKALVAFAIGIIAVTVYYVYWSNDHYLASNWAQFRNGRLIGPQYGSPYSDENVLATLMVVGMPFILFSFFYVKKVWLKGAAVFVLPLLWHSLFLFGSRGALLATVISTFVASRLIKSKMLNKVLLVGFVVAIITQGGAALNRSSETIDKSQDQELEKPINPRLVSWGVGMKLIGEFPLLGVGTQRFQTASHLLYPGESAHVAHNTFINFAANNGLPVGLLFLVLFWLAYKSFKYCSNNGVVDYPMLDYINKSCFVGFIGYFICAIFLDLIVFEGFYFLLLINVAKHYAFSKHLEEQKNDLEQPNNNIEKNQVMTNG